MSKASGSKQGSVDETIAPHSAVDPRCAETIPPDRSGSSPPPGLSETIAPTAAEPGDVEFVLSTAKDTTRHAPDDTVAPAAPLQPQATVDLPRGSPGLNATIDSIPSLGSAARSAAASPPRPQVEGYTILSELGRGGMGVVYKARQKKLNRIVALKMVLAGAHAGQDQLARFYTEAEAVAHLQQPHIVQIYEVGEHAGLPYFSLEYVDGGSLSDRIDGQPQPVDESARMVQLLSRAIGYAHEQGIVHRDLKPANVLLTKAGDPKVTDFGLAKRLESDASQTKSGTLMGTPNYMAPEQARGLVHEVGPLADVYALGVILYEMLTGRTPFLGSSILDTLQQVRSQEPVPPSRLQPKVPRDLETVCLKCLEKEPAKRYETAIALADDLQRYLAGEPILARPAGPVERGWRWCRRNQRVAALSAAVGLLLLSLAIGGPVAAVLVSQQKKLAVANEHAARTAQAAAEINRQKADANARTAAEQRDLAFGAFQTFVTSVSKLRDTAATQTVKQQLLRGGLDGLQKVTRSAESSGRTDATMAAAHQQMGDLLMSLGQYGEARQEFEVTYTIRQSLANELPADFDRQRELAVARSRLGNISALEADRHVARQHYSAALALREKLAGQPGSTAQARIDLATSYVELGNVSNPAEAESLYQKALEIREDVAAKTAAAARPSRDRDVWVTRLKLAEASVRQTDLEKARQHLERGLKQARQLKELMSKSPRATMDLATTYVDFGRVELQAGNTAKAMQLFDDALALLQPAAIEDPQNNELQSTLMMTLARRGQHAVAAKTAEQFRRLAPNNINNQFNIACCYGRCAAAVAMGRPASELTDQEQATHRKYSQQAVAALRSAVSAGFKDKETLATDPDLAPLRDLAEFPQLLAEIP